MTSPHFPFAIDSTTLGTFEFYATCGDTKVLVVVDESDREVALSRSWHITEKGYVRGHGQYLARVILGITDPAIEVDHLDQDKLNNRRSNLQACSHAENMKNRPDYRNNTSGRKGVSFYKKTGKWRAFINDHGHKVLGYFSTFEEAVAAREEAEKYV